MFLWDSSELDIVHHGRDPGFKDKSIPVAMVGGWFGRFPGRHGVERWSVCGSGEGEGKRQEQGWVAMSLGSSWRVRKTGGGGWAVTAGREPVGGVQGEAELGVCRERLGWRSVENQIKLPSVSVVRLNGN